MLNYKDRAMAHQHSSPKNTSVAIIIGLILLILFGYVFATALWQQGIKMIPFDSFTYLRTGLHLAWGDGLGIFRYYARTDRVQFIQTNHYPPLTSLFYGSIAQLGNLPPSMLPATVSLVGWVALLAGIGVLTFQLGKAPLLTALTIILTATSYHLWFIFLHAMSEPLFLPLLVWLMVLSYNLPQREHRCGWRFIGVVLLLMLMMLTRYVGVIVLAAVMLWWAWHWWYTPNRKLTRLIGESTILAASALPIATFMIYFKLQATQDVGVHFIPSRYTFIDGVWEMLLQGSTVFLPNFQVTAITEWIGWYGWIAYGILVLLLVGLLWYVVGTGKVPSWHKPHPSPILLFLLGYVALYTIVQPFLSFYPIDWRDMTTILCLTIPLISGAIAYLPVRWSYVVLSAYIALNVLMAVVQQQIPQPTPYAPQEKQASVTSPKEHQHYEQRPVSKRDSALYSTLADQEDLVAWVQAQPRNHVLLTNDPAFLALHTSSVIEDIANPYFFNTTEPPTAWLDAGSCSSQYPVSIVLFPTDKYARDVEAMKQTIERKCPGLPKRQFDNSVVYTLH